MASLPKTLEILAARADGVATRVLTIAEPSGAGFRQIGGKYIILHTGLVFAEKAVKRAYSLMPGSGDGHAEIAVKRLGRGSNILHEAAVGATFTFSGPWGKLIPEEGLARRTLLVATDTGITSALGVCEGAARAPETPEASELTVLWLRAPGETFLSERAVRERLERVHARFHCIEIPEIHAQERPDAALLHVTALVFETSATHVIATGDGAVVFPLRQLLPGAVGNVRDVRIECFFNNPEKKSV